MHITFEQVLQSASRAHPQKLAVTPVCLSPSHNRLVLSQMDAHSHSLLGAVLSSFGQINKAVVSDLESKTTHGCGDRATCVQRSLEKKPCSSFSVSLLGVTLISLGVVYFLLRCFNLTRKRFWVTSLTRSLAGGGGNPCLGDEEIGEDREVKRGGEGAWVEGLEGTSKERQAGDGYFNHLLWQTGDLRRVPLLPPTPVFWGARGIHGFTSRIGQGAAATALEFYAAQPQDADRQELPQELPCAKEEAGSASRKLMRLHVGGATEGRNYDSASGGGPGARLREGETLQMWERRKIPPYAEEQVVNLFQRMIGAASLCRTLIRKLTQRQRLHMAREVVRLLALELGAFSLVRGHLEPLRSKLANTLLQLSNEALQRSGQDMELEESRSNIRNLVALLSQLSRPRPVSEGDFPSLYRVKMLSLLRTATEVVEFCERVLEGLAEFLVVNKSKPSSDRIAQQIRVVRQLYEVHSSYIARDSLLRRFILQCQKSISLQPLLCHRHAGISSLGLPSMRQLVEEIHRAVRDAGGIPQSPSHATKTHQNVALRSSTSDQQTSTSREPLDEEQRQTRRQEESHSALQPSSSLSGAELQGLQAAAFAEPLQDYPLVLSPVGHLSRPAYSILSEFGTSAAARYWQPFPSTFPHPLLSPSVPSTHLQQLDVQGAPRNASANGRVLSGLVQTRTSEHADLAASQVPGMSPLHESTPSFPSYPQTARRAFAGPNAHGGFPAYTSYGGHSVSHYVAPPSLLPPTARPTGQASYSEHGGNYGTVPGDILQPEEPDQMEGLLADLIRGGLKLEDIFPTGDRPYQ